MPIEIVTPDTAFDDDAAPLLKRITELERYGASPKRINKAREYVNKALGQMDRAYSELR